MTRGDRRWVVTAAAAWALVAAVHGLGARPQAPGAAYLTRSLETPSDRHEERAELLDRPVLPGSLMKVVTLVAALGHGVISPDTTHACRRIVTVDGVRLACSHPDLHRPLDAAEALAYSCNDYFVSLAGRLSRRAFNETRVAAGLPPIDGSTPLGPALVGLAGPRVPPRVMLDVIARIAGFDKDRPMTVSAAARATLVEGLTGAATYGTAAVLDGAGLSALAKTGTSPMPGGGFLGLVVALTPAAAPTRGIVVVAPGAGGTDAASIAADIIGGDEPVGQPRRGRPTSAEAEAPEVPPAVPVPAMTDTVRVGVTGSNGKVRVQRMRLDEYVAEVVTGEGEPRAGAPAQRALAITVRTFALANLGRHRADGFDLCDTTHCQVLRPPTAAARRAAGETTGRILAARGRPASVFYSASCGGRVELASAVWPGADDYATPAGLEDEPCKTDPEWTSEMRASDIERALRAAGLRGDRLRDLEIASRTTSGRAAVLRAEGFRPGTVRAHDFRMAVGRVLGWQRLKSLAFDIRRTGNGYRFRGRGFGHGVGLCVIGAGRRAAAGESTEAILHFYFPGLALATVGAETMTAASPSPRVAPARTSAPAADARPGESARADIELRLPAAEERDRAVIMTAIADARRDVAARSGMPPPAVRVTVHPTVESFARATRQPWWVSAATSGHAIDTLPTSMLRGRGILERTLRHELAHVIVDPTLEGKPLWVREGAALYLAEPNPPDGGPRSRPRCPSDQEILHPPSAGAQREAYARAESCFRVELARGKQWFEVP